MEHLEMNVDYLSRFKAVGQDVVVEPGVYIEHPEAIEVGDHVRFGRGMIWTGRPSQCRIGSQVSFAPGCLISGEGAFLVDDRVRFYAGTTIELGGPGGLVRVGHDSHFAPRCVLYGGGGLEVGPYCNIAAHTVFATVGHDHTIIDQPMAVSPARSGPIRLEEDVWFGANSVVVANVTVAKGCVIGAGAVLTRDTQPMGVYVGVPARRIKTRGEGDGKVTG